jgi:hypothetical protein
MKDTEIIASGYEDTIKQVYSTFFTSYITAEDQNAEQQAEQRFVQGIKVARQIRDRALAILP